MKISEDIYLVGDGQLRLSNPMDCHVYLIDGGDDVALIDAGVGVDSELIFQRVQQDGFRTGDITKLFVTHSHADHAGGARIIREELSCELIVPKYEAEFLENGSEEDLGLDVAKESGIYPNDYKYQHCKADHIVKDNDRIKVGKYWVSVIQVPGHSKGICCLLLESERSRALFSSDVVFLGGAIGLGNWNGCSLSEYRLNIGKLSGLRVDELFPGHYLWTLKDGQDYLDKAIQNLKGAWVPPNFQHAHPHY